MDGDTIRLDNGDLVRYIGINAPETRRREGDHWLEDPQPFAHAATRENARLVAGNTVRLEFDTERTDRFGRTLAYVYVGDIFVNAHLVEQGLARARAYPPNTARQHVLDEAQRRARQAHAGIWAERGG